jgi:Meiotically up-regulated gene 113
MNKEWYRIKIHELAEANGGNAPGAELFYSTTNTKESGWRRKHWNDWNNWGDALEEFGFPRGKFIIGFDRTVILGQLAEFIQSLEPPRYPLVDELTRAKRRGREIPSQGAIRRQLGDRDMVISSLIEFCEGKEEFSRALEVCKSIVPVGLTTIHKITQECAEGDTSRGWVYLIRAQGAYKIGCSRAPYRRAAEIANQSATGAELLHKIETDDPEGIEEYWHRRFSPKRLDGLNKRSGEWFALTPDDVRAFTLRKKFM